MPWGDDAPAGHPWSESLGVALAASLRHFFARHGQLLRPWIRLSSPSSCSSVRTRVHLDATAHREGAAPATPQEEEPALGISPTGINEQSVAVGIHQRRLCCSEDSDAVCSRSSSRSRHSPYARARAPLCRHAVELTQIVLGRELCSHGCGGGTVCGASVPEEG
jgi:hypothetical protein